MREFFTISLHASTTYADSAWAMDAMKKNIDYDMKRKGMKLFNSSNATVKRIDQPDGLSIFNFSWELYGDE